MRSKTGLTEKIDSNFTELRFKFDLHLTKNDFELTFVT